MSLADSAALCHAPSLEPAQLRARRTLPDWLRDCRAQCPQAVPFAAFAGPRVGNERATRIAEVTWVEVTAYLREIGQSVTAGRKRDYPQFSFSTAGFYRDSAVHAVHAIAFDIDAEPQAMNVPAMFWDLGFATLAYETGLSRVVTEQNPLGLARVRIVVPLAGPAPRERFKAFAALLSRAIADATGLTIDSNAATNLFWFAGPRPSADAPPRQVDWTPGFALDWELAEKHLPSAPAEPEPLPAPAMRSRSHAPRFNPQAFFDHALLRGRDAIANAPAGSRNALLNKQVHSLAQLINQGLSVDEITRVAREGCEANGTWREDHKACLRTIKSALRAGQSEPRYPRSRLTYDVEAIRKQALERAVARGLKPRELQVVEAIVSALDVVTGYSTITHETIAQRLGLTVRSVIRIIERLEGRVVVVTRTKIPHPDKPGSTRNAPNQYRIV